MSLKRAKISVYFQNTNHFTKKVTLFVFGSTLVFVKSPYANFIQALFSVSASGLSC